jgi:hypothetical protein
MQSVASFFRVALVAPLPHQPRTMGSVNKRPVAHLSSFFYTFLLFWLSRASALCPEHLYFVSERIFVHELPW